MARLHLCLGVLAGALFSCASWATPPAPSAAALVEMGEWWLKNGPKLQKALGHTGFRAARPGTPILFYNDTSEQVSFQMESHRCKKITEKLKPGESAEFQCKTTSGDAWTKVTFRPRAEEKPVTQKLGNGYAYYFLRDQDTGELSLNIYLDDE